MKDLTTYSDFLSESLSSRDVQERYNNAKNAIDDLFQMFDEYEQDSDAKIAADLGNHVRKELEKMDFKRLMKKVK